jgi:heme exporter protein D
MNKRILLAGLLGGVAMFVWSSIAHMVLPLGQAGIRQIDKEDALLASMQSTLNQPGFYMFPKMSSGNDQAAYMAKIANGPSGMMVYFPRRDFAFGKLLGVEFATELVEAMIAAWILSMTRVATFSGRLRVYALAGVIAAVATNISYWNWYGFPSAYTLGYMFTVWMAYICAGLVAAALKIAGPIASAPAPVN